jgi:hypothetical protein
MAVSSLLLGWLAAVALCFVADTIVGAGSHLVCGHNAGLWFFLFWIVSFAVLAVLWRPTRGGHAPASPAVITCSRCGHHISLDDSTCPHCGFKFGT